jgi:hypothetical protein
VKYKDLYFGGAHAYSTDFTKFSSRLNALNSCAYLDKRNYPVIVLLLLILDELEYVPLH